MKHSGRGTIVRRSLIQFPETPPTQYKASGGTFTALAGQLMIEKLGCDNRRRTKLNGGSVGDTKACDDGGQPEKVAEQARLLENTTSDIQGNQETRFT